MKAREVRLPGRSAIDVERVFDDPERHLVRADAVDGDDVEAAGIFKAAGPGQVIEGHRGNPSLLRTRHGFGRVAAPRRSPRLHFHEDEGWPVLGDDVNFSKARAEPGGKNCVPAFRQRLAGEQFALFSERLAIGGFRHELARSKGRAEATVGIGIGARGFDDKVLALYARGLTVREIQKFVAEIYSIEVSPDLISDVTEAVVGEVTAWQARPLEPMYPVVFFDALRVKIRDEAVVRSKAVYLALAVLPDGTREILEIWIEQTEGAKFWLKVFNDLKMRGCADLIIAVTDGLKGMPEALAVAYPNTTLQTCMVHLIRNSLELAGWQDRKALGPRVPRPGPAAWTIPAASRRRHRRHQHGQDDAPGHRRRVLRRSLTAGQGLGCRTGR